MGRVETPMRPSPSDYGHGSRLGQVLFSVESPESGLSHPKMHRAQMKSDRTSCCSVNANQMRLILHTAAYWLMWTLRQALPETAALKARLGQCHEWDGLRAAP